MRKIFNKYIIGLALLTVGFVSCDTSSQDVSPIVEPDDSYPVATFTLDNQGPYTEGDTIVFTVTLNKPIQRSLTFSGVVDTSLTTMGEDKYYIEPATVPAWETETKMYVYTYADLTFNPAEVLAFKFDIASLAEMYLVNPSQVYPLESLTFENYTENDLNLFFTWDTDIDLGALGTYPTSVNVDFDIFMSPAATFDINDPWASQDGPYAATGNHPEHITLSDYPDGEYVFWFDLWANGFWGYGNTTDIPVYVEAVKIGVFDVTVMQDPNNVINADMPGYDDDGTSTNAVICKVTISGNTYTISDYADVDVVTGKTGAKTPRPANIVKTF